MMMTLAAVPLILRANKGRQRNNIDSADGTGCQAPAELRQYTKECKSFSPVMPSRQNVAVNASGRTAVYAEKFSGK